MPGLGQRRESIRLFVYFSNFDCAILGIKAAAVRRKVRRVNPKNIQFSYQGAGSAGQDIKPYALKFGDADSIQLSFRGSNGSSDALLWSGSARQILLDVLSDVSKAPQSA